MIIECILNILLNGVTTLILALPNVSQQILVIDSMFNIISYGVWICGQVTFSLLIGSVVTWITIHMVYAVVEWIYKKIPGVN